MRRKIRNGLTAIPPLFFRLDVVIFPSLRVNPHPVYLLIRHIIQMNQVKIVTEEPPTKKVKVGEAAEVAVVSPSNGGSSNGKEKATNDEVVFGFFKKVSELLANEEDDEYRDYIKDMIDKYPDLVQVECPAGVDEDWEGMNMVQCLICYAGEFSPDLRDDMYDLVCGGAIATEMCYSMVWDLGSWGYLNMDTVVVLVLSGYMPLRFEESFMIDALFEQCQVQGDPDLIDEVVEILLRKVKAGDSLGCGPVPEKVVARFENLPTLEEGVTHKAGGDFAKYLKEYLKAET